MANVNEVGHKIVKALLFSLLGVAATAMIVGAQGRRTQEPLGNALAEVGAPRPTIVLAHSAIGNTTGWQNLIPILRKDGYKVISVENRFASLADDIAATKKVIEATKGRVVVVAHSYSGAVVTGAAADPKVQALVYVAALAPDANEPIGAFSDKYPPVGASAPAIDPSLLGETIGFPAWRSVRSWYVVSLDDAINPDLQRFFAKRMGATMCETKGRRTASRAPSKTIVQCIEDAALATRN